MLALARESLADLPYDSLRAVTRFAKLIDENSENRLKPAGRTTFLKFVGRLHDGYLRNLFPIIADVMHVAEQNNSPKDWPGGGDSRVA